MLTKMFTHLGQALAHPSIQLGIIAIIFFFVVYIVRDPK